MSKKKWPITPTNLKDEKIIFLDIDGVLNCETDFQSAIFKHNPVHSKLQKGERWKVINYGMLSILNSIVKETDAKIVLSSTWRHHTNPKSLTKIFKKYGDIWQHDELTIVGKTLDGRKGFSDNHNYRRLSEILDFTKEHEITNYVILDDCHEIDLPHKDMDDHYKYKFFKTDEYAGLTVFDAYGIMLTLGRNKKYEKKFNDRQALLSCMF